MIAAGWLVLPAKQTDIDELRIEVAALKTQIIDMRTQTRNDMGDLKRLVRVLLTATKELDDTVRTVRIDLPARP